MLARRGGALSPPAAGGAPTPLHRRGRLEGKKRSAQARLSLSPPQQRERARHGGFLPPPPAAGQGGRGTAPCSRRGSKSRRKKQKGGRERRGSRGAVLNAVAGGRRSHAAALGAVAGEVPSGSGESESGACGKRITLGFDRGDRAQVLIQLELRMTVGSRWTPQI